MKVHRVGSNRYFYPDVTVVCGESRFVDDHRDVLLNPILLIEVLSDNTESFDRGEKFKSYLQLDSLREYVLVSQSSSSSLRSTSSRTRRRRSIGSRT